MVLTAPADDKGAQEQVAEALAGTLAGSFGGVTKVYEQQMSMLLAISAVLASMPETAALDLKKVGAVIHLMASKQNNTEKLRDEMTRMASFIVSMSRRLRDIDTTEYSTPTGWQPPP